MKRLDLVVGPNGAGKSSFVELTLQPLLPRSVFVNADLIAKQRWPEQAQEKSYEAAQIAAATRSQLIAQGHSFIAETVFSHESKLDLIADAQQAGFSVVLHVLLVPESLAVRRVEYRTQSGGHAVPETKIRERFHRLWPLVAVAISRADEATVYNSAVGVAPSVVAEYTAGTLVGVARWPSWSPSVLTDLV